MTRGRIPLRALARARRIAEERGMIQQYVRERGRICDFSIVIPGLVVHARIRCVRRLCCSIAEIERDLAGEISPLRMIAASREISRELWLCSPRYAWRFFRVLDATLVEIGREGSLLPSGDPEPGDRVVVKSAGYPVERGKGGKKIQRKPTPTKPDYPFAPAEVLPAANFPEIPNDDHRETQDPDSLPGLS